MIIRARRKELGLTQKELGQMLDVTHASISNWENEKEPIPDNRYSELAVALRMPESDLRGESSYVRKKDDVSHWRDAVLESHLSLNAMLILMYLPKLVDEVEPALTFSGSVAKIASVVRTLSLEDVQEAWPEVVASRFVERYTDAEWVLRLVFPHSD